MSKERKVVPAVDEGSGNVFADIGLTMTDDDMLKVHIALVISHTIKQRGLTQTEAGAIMGLDQSKVSKILRGRLTEFKERRLIDCLLSLGRDVEVRFPGRWRKDRGELRIKCA
jgi:predicted XRE-type DNA-binding protein